MAGRVVDCDVVGDRFLVRVALPDGTVLRMLADTGGGYHVDPDRVSSLPRVPAPQWGDGALGVDLPLDPPMRSSRLARLIPTTSDVDGVVDAWWFCRRVWAFDYRRGRLEVDVDPLPAGVALGFPRGEDGQLLAPFPRVTAHIDGEDIDMLVDTGATVELTDSAQQQLRRPQFGASSFIVASVFDRWRRDHPTWPFLDHASTARSSPLIQVPTVLIGSTSMEACWFERRRDDDFHVYMSKWMDRTVHGALGATVYRGHRLVIDYVNDLLAIS